MINRDRRTSKIDIMQRAVRGTVLPFLVFCAANPANAQQLVNAFPHLSFQQPIFLTGSGDGTNRIFVAQQNGVISVFPDDSSAGSRTTFLDLSSRLSSSSGEEGLLGLAFHPRYGLNGYFYVDYTAPNPLRTVVARYRASRADPNVADTSSTYVIIEINQPYSNHNGGMLAFGPDGYLYVGMGDGGSEGDPLNMGQDRTVLLGKILRINVDDTTASTHYVIPADNPFTGNILGYREEIWAYGLRNPWRFSFDTASGQLWAGDVGQDTWEEVDLIQRGRNYGWKIMEGPACYSPPSGCDTTGLTMPVKAYDHSLGEAIVGGYVYHGNRRPDLKGAYLYGDWASGRIWVFRYDSGQLTADSLVAVLPGNISSFGLDEAQEIYLTAHSFSTSTGIFRFAGTEVAGVDARNAAIPSGQYMLEQNFPNPFNPSTEIGYRAEGIGWVTLKVYDILGREVATLVDEKQPAGNHTVTWDGSGAASGMYFYRLTTPAITQTRTMLLLR